VGGGINRCQQGSAYVISHRMSPSVSVRLLMTQSDARLLAFAYAGHERAFEALVQRYRRSLLGYCRRLLLSDERAEDALQQALLQAWLALRSGTEVRDVKSWLYRIVHNAALNALRVSDYDYCKLSESLSGADAPQADLDRRIAVREALAGLAALPEMQREALLRTAVEGDTHRQVARDLGLSENALRGLVYRARAALRAAAAAITPTPLLSWALESGGRGAPVIERLAEIGAGGGSAGVAGLLMKGGAVAVTASMLAGGIVAVHTHPKTSPRRPMPQAHLARSEAAPVTSTDAHPASAVQAAETQGARPGHGSPLTDRSGGPAPTALPGGQPPADQATPRLKRAGSQPNSVRYAPAPNYAPSNTRPTSVWAGRMDGGGGVVDHHEAQSSGSNGLGSDATGMGSGDASAHSAGIGEQSSGAGGPGCDGQVGAPTPHGTCGSSADVGGNVSSGNGSSGNGLDGSRSDNSSDSSRSDGNQSTVATPTSEPAAAHDRQIFSDTVTPTRTNSSSKEEPSSGAEATKED
jgi:RNA polymerase sigma factor (sigma-70 family)